LKQNGKPARKPRVVTLRHGGRVMTVAVSEKDSAASVADDLKAVAAKLGKHADVPPEGWTFLFQ
jgi:phage tail sheath gpL-like